MWFFHNGPTTSLSFFILKHFPMHASSKKMSLDRYCRRGAARENNRQTQILEVVVWLLFFYIRYRDYLASIIAHTKTKVHSRTKSTVKFEEKFPFFDWWRVVVGVDSNNSRQICFVLLVHTYTSKSGTNETFSHTHITKQNCIVV